MSNEQLAMSNEQIAISNEPQTRQMKDSGVEWIGEIPAQWDVSTINSLYTLRNQKVSDRDYTPLSVTMKGIVPQLETAAKTDAHDDRKLVKKGDFAINSRSDRRGSCGISNYDGSVSLINTVLTPRGEMHPVYYNWLFHSARFADEFYRWGHGIVDDLWTTRWQEMRNITIPVPEYAVQQIIADHLDRKCTQIDTLIANQQQQIEKLKAYKQSVITETVTKGLDPDVAMKDSGVEWIGEIPEHWEVVRIKNICSFNPSSRKTYSDSDIVSYAPMECVRTGQLLHKEIQIKNISSGLTYFEENDIIMAKVTPCFENGNIAIATELTNGIAFGSSELFVFRARSEIRHFLFYFLQNDVFKNYAAATMTGTGGLKRVSPGFVNNFHLALPSKDERNQIVEYLNEKCGQIDRLIAIKQQKIERIQQYKKSVIYEYVTGKREV